MRHTMLNFIAPLGGFALPLLAIFLAIGEAGFKFDGTITLGNVFTAAAFIIGGLLAIAAIPRQVKNMSEWIVEHDKWAKEQTKQFNFQITELRIMNAQIKTLLEATIGRVSTLEDRLNDQ